MIASRSVLTLTAALTAPLSISAAPAGAATAAPKELTSGYISVSAVSGSLPVGATVSVLQFCPAGSALWTGPAPARRLGSSM